MQTVRLRNILLLVAALAASVALAACGGDDETTSSASETTSSETTSTTSEDTSTEDTSSDDTNTPEGAAKAFLVAIANGDGETACGYASEAALKQIEAAGTCEDQVTQALGSISDEDKKAVEDATFETTKETDNSATVTATKPDGTDETFTLVIEDGEWKIDG